MSTVVNGDLLVDDATIGSMKRERERERER